MLKAHWGALAALDFFQVEVKRWINVILPTKAPEQ